MPYTFATIGLTLAITSVADINGAGSGTTLNFSSFPGGATDFNLISAKVAVARPDTSGAKSTFIIEDSNPTLGTGTVNRVLQPGSTYTLTVGKSAALATTTLKGVIEKRRITRNVNKEVQYELTCYDYNARLIQRIVNVHRFQNMKSDGTLDTTDTRMDVTNLAKYVIGYLADGSTAISDAYQPMVQDSNVKTLAADDGFTVNNLTATTHLLPTYDADFRAVADVLKDLANQVGYTYFVDTNKNLNFVPIAGGSAASGITLSTNPSESVSDATKLGYITDLDDPMIITEDLTDTKNGIIGISGNNTTPNYTQTDVTGGAIKLDTGFLAQKLPTLSDNRLSQISVWIAKVGTPSADLFGEIREDDGSGGGGKPLGALVKAFQIPRGDIPVTANWVTADYDPPYINTSVGHWLVLWGGYTGISGSNYYQWYKDSSITKTNASATWISPPTAPTWSVNNANSYQFAFLLFNKEKMVHSLYDASSIAAYGLREDVFRDNEIKTTDALWQAVSRIFTLSRFMKQTIECYVLPPNVNMTIGTTCTIIDSVSGINGTYKIVQLDYIFKEGAEQSIQVKVTATKVNIL